ncbi:hypothetical protein GCM10009727_03500 [Actinomadura napierensis]|uniref:Uncharacterized protein n=1 Tax=Actinomadura napierensis TaxID=267854 RepID=A0ABN2Y356_9ACTN
MSCVPGSIAQEASSGGAALRGVMEPPDQTSQGGENVLGRRVGWERLAWHIARHE